MPDFQKTISKSISFIGSGIHTGHEVSVNLIPAEANTGIYFKRIDLDNQPLIKADIDFVVDITRGTTIEHKGVKIATVEHLLAAISSMGIDNLIIELNDIEIPIMDGSAKPFVDIIEKAGIENQTIEREYFVLEETIHFYDEEKDVEMTAVPCDNYEVTVMIDFNANVIGKQFAQLKDLKQFKEDFASSRTFCFLNEVKPLLEKGLIKGGDLSNAIVLADNALPKKEMKELSKLFDVSLDEINQTGIVNKVELRYKNEPARHKLVDVIGDLSLVGVPIKAKIIASKPGHATNIEFGKKLKRYIVEKNKLKEVPKYDANCKIVYDLKGITNLLPHRYPFLMIDKIIELGENHVVGVKNVTINEPFFQGHFPNDPIMPGVLQIEAMAQTGGVLTLSMQDEPSKFSTYFLRIEQCKFRKPVRPGDTLLIKMTLTQPIRRGICQMKGAIYVGNDIVTEAHLVAKIFKN